MFNTVRVIDKNTPSSYIWGLRLSKFSFWLMILCLGIALFFTCVIATKDVETSINIINALKLGINGDVVTNGVVEMGYFIPTIMWIATIIFATLFGLSFWIMKLDIPFNSKKEQKMQNKLKKYEYKMVKKTNNIQNKTSNKALKKDLMKQYKENKI